MSVLFRFILPLPRQGRAFGWIFPLLLLLFPGPGVRAVRAGPPPSPDVLELWVPRKNLAEVLKTAPRSIVLTEEQYAALLRDSRARTAPEKIVPPAAAILTDARYEGRPGEGFVSFHADFTVECLTDDWTQVPLALHPQWLGGVKLDGESAVQPSGDLSLPETRTILTICGRGRHSLGVDFALPLEEVDGRRGFTLPEPGAAGAQLTLAVPDTLKLESSAPFHRQAGAAVFALSAQMGKIRVSWAPQDLAPLETGAVFQESRMSYAIDPARLSADLALSWNSPLRPLPPRLVLPLPPGVPVLGADGPEIRQWTLAGDRLVIDFKPGERKSASVRLALEKPVVFPEGGGPQVLALPAPVADGVFRTSGQFSLSVSGGLRVRSVEAGPLAERDDSRTLGNAGADVFGTWVFPLLPKAPEVELQQLSVQFAATLDTQISLTREAVRLKRWLTLTPRDGTLFSPSLEGLGADEEIDSVRSADDKEQPWKKTAKGLMFPGSEGLPAGKPWTVVVSSRLDPKGWQEMSAEALTLSMNSATVPGAGKVNGYVALESDEALEVVSQPLSGLEPRDPAQFAGTLPLRGQLAWSRLENFKLRLSVSRRAPEYDASVLVYALPLLNSLELEGQLELVIGRSPLRELRVVFPAEVAAAVRWDSPLLSESRLEPDNTWALRFHREAEGHCPLRFRLSMPLTDSTAAGPESGGGTAAGKGEFAPERRFTAAVPVLSVMGARRLSGTVVVEANTDTELSFTATGLNPLDSLRAPAIPGYQPIHRIVSAWTWPGGNPALSIHGLRHRAGSLVSTVIDRLTLDTVISAEGPVRHQARLEVRTAGDQFLDIVLPPEARVLTLLVDDATTKPVLNRQGGLRVPLPGPLAVIRLICECPGAGLESTETARLIPVTPDPALPVLDTQWRLHLPDGYSYSGFDTNLTESGEGQASVETPEFLALLGSGLSSSSVQFKAGGGSSGDPRTVAEFRERNTRVLSVLESRIKRQEDEVTDARQEVLRLMKQHGIIDTALLGGGGGGLPYAGTSNSLFLQSREKELEMQTQLAKFKANLSDLEKLPEDQQIGAEMSFGVEDDTLKQFAAHWEKDKAGYEALLSSGLGKDHPKVRQLAESIEKQGAVLREAAANYRKTLAINIQNIESALQSVKTTAAEGASENVNEKVNAAEYKVAEQAWQQKREQLNRLREQVLRTESDQEAWSAVPGDEPYRRQPKENILPVPEDSNTALYDVAPEAEKALPETPVPAKPVLETRTFQVPLDFLALSHGAAGASDAPASGDPFATSKDEASALAGRPSARSLLTKLGVEFGEGATATFSPGTGTLVVRNTPAQLAAAGSVLTELKGRGGDGSVPAAADALDRQGILPLDFALPEGGRVYHFAGQYPPGVLTFQCHSWQRQMRWTWLWILCGSGAFWLLARRSPLFMGILGALVIQFLPGLLGLSAWLPQANALVIGWILAIPLRLILGRFRRTSPSVDAQPPSVPAARIPAAPLMGCLLLMAAAISTTSAGEPAPDAGAVPAPPKVVTPFDPDKPLSAQTPERRYIDYATFQRMWEDAKANRRKETSPPPAAPEERAATLISALHHAEVLNGVMRVESVFTLLTRGPDWTGVPLALENSLRSLSLDGSPATLNNGQLLVEKAGSHRITAAYDVPLAPGWQEVSWRVPAATAASLALSLSMDDPARPLVNAGAPLTETTAEGRRVFTASLGTVDRISLRRRTAVQQAGIRNAEPALARISTRVFVSPALERIESSILYTFADQERGVFTLRLDPALVPVSFSVPGLESWSLRREATAQVIELQLSHPARESFSLSLVAERPLAGFPLTETAPLVSAAAGRLEQVWTVLATNDVEVRPLPAGGLQRLPLDSALAGGASGFEALGSWQGGGNAGPPQWELRPRLPEASATLRYALQPGADKLELSVGMELHAQADRELRDLTVRLPEETTVQGVSGERLTDWWQEGRVLRVRFSRQLSDEPLTRLALNLTRPLPPGTRDFTFSPLVVEGFSKVSGSGLLIAPVNQETGLKLTPVSPDLKETAPEETATGFSIRPPFEAKRGFVFTGSDWTVTAALKPLAARYEVDWVMDAEARDSWVELNTRVMLSLSRGGLEGVEFTTPASAPVFRVTGEGLRGTSSVVEGPVRRYTLSFQSLRTGTVFFSLNAQMPLPGGGDGAELPDIAFPGAAGISRFVIAENRSGGDMKLGPAGMDITPREQVSLLPVELVSGRTGAQFYRARPGWSMKVAVEKLETTAGQKAVVLQADLTTSLLRNGDVWQRAVYVLENRSLQFLPVSLPEGAEVISVVVAGESTRADSGSVEGSPVLLVPLIQTEPGELATEVTLIYRLRGKAGEFPAALRDPGLPGLSIGQTFWTVQYPDGFKVETGGGNMTPVKPAEWSDVKAVSRLSELNSLRRVAESDFYDSGTRERARGNAQKIASVWGAALQSEAGREYQRIAGELSARPIPAALPDGAVRALSDGDDRRDFVLNRAPTEKPAQSVPPPAVPGNLETLSLNDHVSWAYEGQQILREKTPQGQNARRLSQIDRLQERAGERSPAGFVTATAGVATKKDAALIEEQPDVRQQQMQEDRKSVEFSNLNKNYSFGNARLNNLQQAAAPSEPALAPAAADKKSKAEETRNDSGKLAEIAASAKAPAQAPAGPEGTASTASPSRETLSAPQPRLRTVGRVSLEAVFPSQPQEIHFHKMKGDALLELKLSDTVNRGIRWKGLAGFGLVLGVALGFRRLLRKSPA